MGKDEYGSLVARARESNDQNSHAEFQRANGCSKNCGTKLLTFFLLFYHKTTGTSKHKRSTDLCPTRQQPESLFDRIRKNATLAF